MVADSIAGVLRAAGSASTEPDRAAIQGFLTHRRLVGHTVLNEVRSVPPGHMLTQQAAGPATSPIPWPSQQGDLHALLRASLQQALNTGRRTALALSGGLDSALLLALLRDLDALQDVPCYILATGLPDYCERAAALDMATRMRARPIVVPVGPHDFVNALPCATQCVAEPMFNLHPVAKLLLARAMAADGIEQVVTGDGADQVLRRDTSANYLPLCQALFRAEQITLHAPFLNDGVMAHLLSLPPDPDKQCLRKLAQHLGLPHRLVHGPKCSRLAPAMDLQGLVTHAQIRSLARHLHFAAPALQTDNECMLWTTLTLTLQQLGAGHQP